MRESACGGLCGNWMGDAEASVRLVESLQVPQVRGSKGASRAPGDGKKSDVALFSLSMLYRMQLGCLLRSPGCWCYERL